MDDINNHDELEIWFEEIRKRSVLADMWVQNLLKPVFLILLYIRAEREGEFVLHLYACKKMMPYFFAAGHVNYARYVI